MSVGHGAHLRLEQRQDVFEDITSDKDILHSVEKYVKTKMFVTDLSKIQHPLEVELKKIIIKDYASRTQSVNMNTSTMVDTIFIGSQPIKSFSKLIDHLYAGLKRAQEIRDTVHIELP